MTNSVAEALAQYRERVEYFVERAQNDARLGVDDVDWVEVITREATRLVQEGPAAYLAYLREAEE